MGVELKLYGYCIGLVLVLYWYRLGLVLVLEIGFMLVVGWLCFRTYRYSFSISLVLCRYWSGIVLVLCWYCVGIVLVLVLVLMLYCFGSGLVVFWYQTLQYWY